MYDPKHENAEANHRVQQIEDRHEEKDDVHQDSEQNIDGNIQHEHRHAKEDGLHRPKRTN